MEAHCCSTTHVDNVNARADGRFGWRSNQGRYLPPQSARPRRSLKPGAELELTAPLELVLRYSSGRFPFSSRTTSI